ncbi:response regulator [Deinococcus knuensis]|uniref:Response regulator n=1 Tax=Deinococcus knuensis TaxID=1837380 RepID=A0ABQ2SNV4_9DEIO|nr:response regulator [Deinococcus knuensis]GGS35466.1 response regulator [Deinococcus knuensis]
MQRTLRVLLVDDSPHDLELATIAFEEHESDTEVTTCSGGHDALAHLRDPQKSLPHVVVLDLNMPMMSGLEVLEAIRTDPLLQPLTVVILSTSNDPGDIQAAYRLFASSYMIKQQNFPDFVEQVDQFIQYWRRCQFPTVQQNP